MIARWAITPRTGLFGSRHITYRDIHCVRSTKLYRPQVHDVALWLPRPQMLRAIEDLFISAGHLFIPA